MDDEEGFGFEFELKPRLLATVLWGLGIGLWFLTVHAMLMWHGWIGNVEDALFVLVSFICGLNAMAMGFLVDMHSMEYKGVRFGIRRRKRERKRDNEALRL